MVHVALRKRGELTQQLLSGVDRRCGQVLQVCTLNALVHSTLRGWRIEDGVYRMEIQ